MDSRNLLGEKSQLGILVDVESIDPIVSSDSDLVRLLAHISRDDFKFYRTTQSPSSSVLSSLPTTAKIGSSFVDRARDSDELAPFGLSETQEMWLARTVFANGLRDEAHEAQPLLILTANETLLSHRLELDMTFGEMLYGSMPSGSMPRLSAFMTRTNLATAEELIEILGLAQRNILRYVVGTAEQVSKPQWFEYLIMLNLPHLGFDTSSMSLTPRGSPHGVHHTAFKSRVGSLLSGLDEIGFQYYMGVDFYPTEFDIEYHVDYCFSLLTSILDHLALHTQEKLNIQCSRNQVALTTNRNFITKIKDDGYTELYNHIQQNHSLLNMVYKIRNGIVHRNSAMPGWKSGAAQSYETVNGERVLTRSERRHVIDLTLLGEDEYNSVAKDYGHLDDAPLTYNRLTELGLCSDTADLPNSSGSVRFEPFQMLKELTRRLLDFSDEYLRTLGYENLFNQLEDDSNIRSSLEHMHEYELSLLVPEQLPS